MAAQATTGFVWDERYLWHETPSAMGWLPSRGLLPPGEFFENPETKRRMKQLDRLIDDGNLDAGFFRRYGSIYCYILKKRGQA